MPGDDHAFSASRIALSRALIQWIVRGRTDGQSTDA
jgi:hypothetical protein